MVEYSCATLFRELDNYGGQRPFVVDDVLDISGVGQYMHYVKQRDINMYLLDHLNKTGKLLIHGCLHVTGGERQETGFDIVPFLVPWFLLDLLVVLLPGLPVLFLHG